MKRYDELRRKDLHHLWHPYTDIAKFEGIDFPIIERAEGVYLYDDRGRALMDGISSWWCVNLGHSHPRLIEAIRRQAPTLQHSILGGMSHSGAILLAEALARIAPKGLRRVLFASDGASAVEAALRVSLQYWANVGRPERRRFVSLEDAYHGDTLGAVGVGYVEAFHAPLKHVLGEALRAESPHCFHCRRGESPDSCEVACFQSMERIVREANDTVAAVIIEPICQAAAGMRIYPAEYLRRLRRLCDECGVLLIADEIAVGFGRTGRMFAMEHAGVSPDILCVGKALTGGYLPMSAALVTDRIYEAFRSVGADDRTFYHGHTFSGNPLASAVALASIETYEDERILPECRETAKRLASGIERLSALGSVANTATQGMMSAVEISPRAGGAALAARIAAKALDLGLFIRPLGSILYLWPPLVTTRAELDQMLAIFGQAVADVS